MRFHFLLLLTGFALITMGNIEPAQANNFGMTSSKALKLSVLRSAYSKDEFTIRFASNAAITGCYDITPPKVEKIDAGAVIYVEFEGGELNVDKKPTYGHFECDMKAGGIFVDVPFNKETLKENGTKTIEFKDEKIGKLFDVELDHQADRLVLESEIKLPVRLSEEEKKETFNLWDYPENTIVVYVNTLGNDYDSIKKLKTFAQSRGLTPIQEVLEGFPMPKDYETELFFVDHRNVYKEELAKNKPFVIGNITQYEKYNSANGPYDKTKEISVYARKIGSTD